MIKAIDSTTVKTNTYVLELNIGDIVVNKITKEMFVVDNDRNLLKMVEPEPILTEEEKDIFSKVMDLLFITKDNYFGKECVYVETLYSCVYLDLECKGLKVGKQYSKEELGL